MAKKLKTEKIKEKKFFRSMTSEAPGIDVEKRTVEFSFSSELPVERYFGMEILDHAAGSCDMSRLNNAAAVLWNHDWDEQIAVVEKSWLDNVQRKLYAQVRFSENEDADAIFKDVCAGIIKNVSFGYTTAKRVLEKTENDMDFYRVTSWMPYEISFVSVPADPGVGVGRSSSQEDVNDCEVVSGATDDDQEEANKKNTQTTQNNEGQKMAEEHAQVLTDERSRVKEISAIGKKFQLESESEKAIAGGVSVAEFQKSVLAEIEKRNVATATAKSNDNLGLNEKEKRSFSFLRAINALANPTDKRSQDAAGFEYEVSNAFAAKRGLNPKGILIPMEILAHRDFNLTTGAGSNAVATNLLAGSFIDKLDNAMLINALGATVLRDLVGNVDIPRQTGRATGYWIDPEGAAITGASNPTLDQVSLSPKTVGAYTDVSRRLLLQSSLDIESLVRNDLAKVIALMIDYAAIAGTGLSNTPKGIIHQDNIGSLNWATAATPSWAKIVELETKVDVANAATSKAVYLMESLMRGKLKTTEISSGYPQFIMQSDGSVNGYKSAVSNQVPDYNVIFGDFSDVILAFWSGLDLTVDPFTNATSGKVRVIALQDCDVALRRPESFALGSNPTVS
jgi:HK97 family phage major capsid protein/HK97 family phage prohead protease